MTTTATPYPIDRVLSEVATRPDVLATLRRGVGRTLEEAPGSWPWVMKVAGGNRGREEAAHVALALFALHHQSQERGSMQHNGWGLGRSCRVLAQRRSVGGSKEGVERRLRAALAAESLTALAVHLRGLVTLLRGEGIPLDYARLFWDLTSWRSSERRNKVALRWARDYFMTSTEDQAEEAAS